MVTATQNPDGSVVVVLFNPMEIKKTLSIAYKDHTVNTSIAPKAIQTIVLKEAKK
jgi:glucosylceramidase